MVNYHYDAYGVLVEIGGPVAGILGTLNPLTYRGYVYDHDTGLYYLQSRYYNPAIRQFINADAFVSTGQGIMGYNMFAYCLNNPVCFADPTGTYSIYDTRAIFGGGGLGGPGAMYVTGVPSLSSIGGYVTSAAVSVKVVADVYNAINKQGEIPSSGCSIPSAPTPPKPDDDDDDDYYDNNDNFARRERIGKIKGKTPRNNQVQNKQFHDATKKLSKANQRYIHRETSGRGMDYHEIKALAEELFPVVIVCFPVNNNE